MGDKKMFWQILGAVFRVGNAIADAASRDDWERVEEITKGIQAAATFRDAEDAVRRMREREGHA